MAKRYWLKLYLKPSELAYSLENF